MGLVRSFTLYTCLSCMFVCMHEEEVFLFPHHCMFLPLTLHTAWFLPQLTVWLEEVGSLPSFLRSCGQVAFHAAALWDCFLNMLHTHTVHTRYTHTAAILPGPFALRALQASYTHVPLFHTIQYMSHPTRGLTFAALLPIRFSTLCSSHYMPCIPYGIILH